MSQKLILPVDKMQMTAAYKNAKYREYWGFGHYGVDCIHTQKLRNVHALGDGEVIACGMDGSVPTGSSSRLGNCIVIVYKDVICNDSTVRDLACRMFHFDSIAVKKGDKVKAGQTIGVYGNTGASTSGPHLHIEFDTDIEYPCHAVGIKASGNVIKQGTTDSTGGWTGADDVDIPKADEHCHPYHRLSLRRRQGHRHYVSSVYVCSQRHNAQSPSIRGT